VAEQLGVEKAQAIQDRRALIGEKRRRKTDRWRNRKENE